MKKSIYLTILFGITVVCMIAGSLYHVGGLGRRIRSSVITTETSATAGKTGASGNIPSTEQAGKSSGEAKQEADAITSLMVDMQVGSLVLLSGSNTYSAAFEGESKYEPEISLQGGQLRIIQGKQSDWNLINFKGPSAKLTVTLPEGTALEDMQITLHLGEADLRDIITTQGILQMDLGEAELTNCQLGDFSIDANMGDVEVKNCAFQNLTIEQDMGDVEVKTWQSLMPPHLTLDLQTDLGEIEVNDRKQGMQYYMEGDGGSTLTVHNAMGDIEIDYD